MKKVASVLCLMLVLCMTVSTMTTAFAYQTDIERYYPSYIEELRNYVNGISDKPLDDFYRDFDECGDYKLSKAFKVYSGILYMIETGENLMTYKPGGTSAEKQLSEKTTSELDGKAISALLLQISLLHTSPDFEQFLIEDSDLPDIQDIENYVLGRKAELENDREKAISMYMQANEFYDSWERLRLLGGIFEENYATARIYYDYGTYDACLIALELFEELAANHYSDSAYYAELTRKKLIETKPTPSPTPQPFTKSAQNLHADSFGASITFYKDADINSGIHYTTDSSRKFTVLQENDIWINVRDAYGTVGYLLRKDARLFFPTPTPTPKLTPTPTPTPSPKPTPTPISVYNRAYGNSYTTYASSYRQNNSSSVHYRNLTDGDEYTSWDTNNDPYATFYLQTSDGQRYAIKGFEILNGKMKDGYRSGVDYWRKNSRIKSVDVYADGSYIGTYRVEDLRSWQRIDFNRTIIASKIEFRIQEVYRGDDYKNCKDVCVREIRLY